MDCEEKHIDNILIIKLLSSRFDAHIAEDFKSTMHHHIENSHRRIVLDLSEINFIDSSGLGTIVHLLKMLKGDGDIIISGATDTVMRMFKLTRMNKIFKMVENELLAIDILKKEPIRED